MNRAFTNKLEDVIRNLPRLVKRLPGIAKAEGLKFIADNFRNEGFEEQQGQYKKWQKKKTKGARKPQLVGEKRGGAMRRGWQGKASESAAEFSNSLPYAGVHNEGLQAGRPPGFTMPQRQMIGESPALLSRIEKKADKLAEELFL